VQEAVERLLGTGDAVAVRVGRAEELQTDPLRVDALGTNEIAAVLRCAAASPKAIRCLMPGSRWRAR
jgi:hypothetical protein